MIRELVTPVVAGATILSNVVFIVCIALYYGSPKVRAWAEVFTLQYFNQIVFTVAFTALVGSLTYSEIVGFTPCDLCWWARICMYPLVVLAVVAWKRKIKDLVHYVIPLSLIGIIITLYHSFVLWGGKSFLPCTQQGSACAKIYVFEYGYVTIPVMALSCFAYIVAFSLIYKKILKK